LYYYQATIDSGGTVKGRLTKIVDGTSTNLVDNTQTFTAGDTYETEANGSTIRGLINGTEKESVTDTDVTGNTTIVIGTRIKDGSVGDAELDNFEGADLAVAAGHHRVGFGAGYSQPSP